MAKMEEYENDGSSDDGFSYNNALSSRIKPSSGSVLVKVVKVEACDNDGSSDDDYLYRNVGSSSLKPLSGPAPVKETTHSSLPSADLKSNLVGMGFSSVLVDKVIKEHGGADENLLVEALFNYSKEIPEDSDSWDDCEKEEENPANNCTSNIKQEIEELSEPPNMDKKSQLLMMDFSEKEINFAVSRLGEEASLPDLVDFIFAAQAADSLGDNNMNGSVEYHNVKTEDAWDEYEALKPFKKAKHLFAENNIGSCSNHMQQVKQEEWDQHMPYIKEEVDIPRMHHPRANPRANGNNHLKSKPYFFYGNVVDVSHETWKKLSQFLYGTEPEFVNTQYFSALIRKEGYLHNLPSINRFHINPNPPMNLEEVLPNTKKWWPSWDTRKQLNSIVSETTGLNQLCERLSKIMIETRGFLSREQQLDFIHQCKCSNLVWVGPHKLRPIEPDQVENILGYPSQHTENWGLQTSDRLALLRHSFQTDTIGYHLSVLKSMYPDGISVLSINSGIGGAEIALHRLGIQLKFVLSVEPSETNRNILRRWWENSGQRGVLKQIGGIEKLTSNMLESYTNQYGGFDVVIGSNPGEHARGSSKSSSVDLDFSLYYEFVRVYQRVRNMVGRS